MTASYVSPALFVNWQGESGRQVFPVGRLLNLSGDSYEFAYLAAAKEAQQLGFVPFVAFPELERVYISSELPAFFKNRVLQPARPDYPEHLAELGLDPATATPIAILARSGGRRVTDPLEVFAELVPTTDATRVEAHFFVRGIRHVAGAEEVLTQLAPGDSLTPQPEPTNAVSPKALLLARPDTRRVGYVPDYLAEDLNGLTVSDPSLLIQVVRVNAAPSPSQQRLLCRLSISATAPRPHRGARFEPIASDALRLEAGELVATSVPRLTRTEDAAAELR
jgi:hypothetical protein